MWRRGREAVSSRGPVLVLGLDGAGWPVLDPLMEDGRLPFLTRLRAEGAWAPLMSPWPGATFPSWTSIMTGVTPGVHGMLDFTTFDPATYTVRFTDSTSRRVPTVWELAHGAGRCCAVLGVPGTFPPDDIDLMISGFDTPVTTSIEPSFVHPPAWRGKLAAVGGFPLTPVQELRIGAGWHRAAWRALRESIEGKVRVAQMVVRDLKPELFVMVFGESDTVCHHFWPFADSASPRRVAGADEGLADTIADVYSRLDRAAARIVESAHPSMVIIASDHGFGGAGVEGIHLNRYLASCGFLRFRPGPLPALPLHRAAGLLPRRAQQSVFRRARRLVGAVESRRRLGGIRLSATTAYSEELPYAPAVRINLQGREGRGTVAPAHYEQVRDDVAAALLAWRDSSGAPVVARVWRREELDSGPAVSSMPDLALDLAVHGGYTYVVRPSGGSSGPIVTKLDPLRLGGKGLGMGGTHRREGVLLAWGEGVRPGPILDSVGAHQVAAAVMAALGVATPSSMAAPPPALPQPLRSGALTSMTERAETGSEPWEWERMKRLRGLGYIE